MDEMNAPRIAKRERWERQRTFGDVPDPRNLPFSTGSDTCQFSPALKSPKTPEEFKAAFGKPIGGLFKLEPEEMDIQHALKDTRPSHRRWKFKIVWKTPAQALKQQYEMYKLDCASAGLHTESEAEWIEGYDKRKVAEMIKDTESPWWDIRVGFPIVTVIKNKDGTLWSNQEGHHRIIVAREKGWKVPILIATAIKELPTGNSILKEHERGIEGLK